MNNEDLIETNDLSKEANGGTEQMLRRIYDGKIPRELLEQFQIIPTRVRDLNEDKYRIYFINDLPGDPEVQHLANGGWYQFHRIVFVSNWQAQNFIHHFNIPWSKCLVMLNAIDPVPQGQNLRSNPTIKLIYHTTPHRGLNILLPVFDRLSQEFPNIHLDIYSSFRLYGWNQRDEHFKDLFDFADQHEKITNHGTVPNEEVRIALGLSDIFAYPSIWPETSCLCLMEAMSAGLNCVHPNYGALYETAAGWTSMYNWNEEANEHAKIFYMMLKNAIENVGNENFIGRIQSQKVYVDAFYNWESRSRQWQALMESIIFNKEEKKASKPEEEFRYSA